MPAEPTPTASTVPTPAPSSDIRVCPTCRRRLACGDSDAVCDACGAVLTAIMEVLESMGATTEPGGAR